MKNRKTVLLALLFGLFLSFNASAWWGNNGWGNNGWGNNGWGNGWNSWPEWTPMYWMEEMSDEMGGNNWGGYGGPYGYGGGPYSYGGYGPYGYGGGPYGYGGGYGPYGYGGGYGPSNYGYYGNVAPEQPPQNESE